MKTKKINILSSQFLFYVLIILSILVTLGMLFPDIGIMVGSSIFILWIPHFFAGVGLTIATYKEKISGKRKFFLLSSGFSSAGFLLCVVLHNLFYALGTITENLVILNKIINFLGVAFFFVAIIICPVGFIVGMVGTLIISKKLQSEKT
ncbi:MAG TPA: hypothetical protein G4N92_04620 [Anaerolineae bacterium]|nr:hypothetical protein [Anaerolineae bacterium]